MKNIGKALILSAGVLTASAVTPFEAFGASPAVYSSVKMPATSFKITAATGLRSNAGTGYKILVPLPKNQTVVSAEKKGNWYKVSFKTKVKGKILSKVGWVHASYLKENILVTAIPTSYYFTKTTTNLYSSPDTKKKEVYKIAGNTGFPSTQKIVNGSGQTWFRITFASKTLYFKSSDVISRPFTSLTNTKFRATVDSNLYASYGISHKKLMAIPKGTDVFSTKKIGDWYGVTINGVSGYVSSNDFIKNTEVTFTSYDMNEITFFTTKSAKLYSVPDSSKAEVSTVDANNGFTSVKKAVNSLGETWYQLSFGDQLLYIKSADVITKTLESFPQTAFKAKTDATIYSSYGAVFAKLSFIPKDTLITLNSRIGDWYPVTFNGITGYVNKSDLQVSENPIANTTYVTKSDVPLNVSPDPSSAIVSPIPASKLVLASAKTSNGWYKVTYSGQTGYIPEQSMKQVKTGDPMTSHDGYQFIDLRTQSTVTAKQIDDFIASNLSANFKGKKSVLVGTGKAFIAAGTTYGINALYLAAHAIHESAFGTSAISLTKNNLFGFGAYDSTPFMGAYRFASVDLCINYIAREIKATYLNPNPSNWKYNGAYLGFSTTELSGTRINANSEGMNFYYASDPNWGKLIASYMEKILPYDKAYYHQAAIDTTYPTSPPIPEGSDVFPANIQAVAVSDLILNSDKGLHDAVKTLPKGTSFTILEKTNDHWIKVLVDNTVYWTSIFDFNHYKNYMTVLNLGRALDVVNVRSTPTAVDDTNKLSYLNLNDFVSFVINTDGTPVMDSSKMWYNIQLADGTTAWVSSKYITRELK